MIYGVLSFLQISLVMTVIILGILLIHTLFSNMFPATLRYMVWIVVLIGVVIPIRPVIGSGGFIFNLPVSIEQDDKALWSLSERVQETEAKQDVADTDGIKSSRQENLGISPVSYIVIIWIAGAFLLFTFHIYQYRNFHKRVRRWGNLVEDETILSIFRTVLEEKGVEHKGIQLRICSFVSTSMLTGFFHPLILLPNKVFEEDELELIFRHELIHYKRHDLWIKLLSLVAISIHWFNPLLYWMNKAIQAEGEASCDEEVIREVGMEHRHFYAEVILGMVGKQRSSQTALTTCFYGGKNGIKNRLNSIIDIRGEIKPLFRYVILTAVLILTILSGSMVTITSSNGQEAVKTIEDLTQAQADEIALVTVGGGTIIERQYDIEQKLYHIDILLGENKYYVDVNGQNGEIVDYQVSALETDGLATPDALTESTSVVSETTTFDSSLESISVVIEPSSAVIESSSILELTIDQATAIALTKIGGSSKGTVIECERDKDDGRIVYEIKIKSEHLEYEMNVDVLTGDITDYSVETMNDH